VGGEEIFHTPLFLHFRDVLQEYEVGMAAVQRQQNSELADVYGQLSQG